MKEELLHYVWAQQHFPKRALRTVSGDRIRVLKAGTLNRGAGPDFRNACVKIGNVLWRGDIEVHLKSSDWCAHKHTADKRYNSVILHVVWEDNKDVFRLDGTQVPTLVLKEHIEEKLLLRYQALMKEKSMIPCSAQFSNIAAEVRKGMLEKVLSQRFRDKYRFVDKLFRANKDDTEAVVYQLLGYNFGFKANSDAFLRLVKIVPLRLIAQHRRNLLYIEALLLGQAGLLPSVKEGKKLEGSYVRELLESYEYLQKKHFLEAPMLESEWQFFRLRPGNFPTIRITQFARLLHIYPALFGLLVNSTASQLRRKLAIKQSSYWQKHYLLGKKSTTKIGGLGEASIDNILINTVVPLLVTYGTLRSDDFFIQKAKKILRSLPPEDNVIVRRWHQVGLVPKDAFESQASIALFKHFCQAKKCLSCDIGKHLLRR